MISSLREQFHKQHTTMHLRKDLLVVIILASIMSVAQGQIIMVERHDGTVLGPYRPDTLVPHDMGNGELMEAQPLIQEVEEGSGMSVEGSSDGANVFDDLESGEVEMNPDIYFTGDYAIMDGKNELIAVADFESSGGGETIIVAPSTSPAPVSTTTTTSTSTSVQPTVKPSVAPSSTTTASPDVTECLSACRSALHRTFNMAVTPNTTYIRQNSQLKLKCNIVAAGALSWLSDPVVRDAKITWIFEGQNKPQRECALNTEPYLESCGDFKTIIDTEDTTDDLISSSLTIQNLQTQNSGLYSCQVRLECCDGRGVMQHKQSHLLVVWHEDYTMELAILGCLIVGLAAIVIALLIYKRKIERSRKESYMQVPGKCYHLPNEQKVNHFMMDVGEDGNTRDSFTSDESSSLHNDES